MPIPTRAELKAYFETGDHPTQAQFAALVDAIYDLVQSATDVADTAVAAAAAAEALVGERAAKAFALLDTKASIPGGTFEWQTRNVVGAAIVLSGTKKSTVTVTFDTALPDAFYTILPLNEGTTMAITSKTAAAVIFTLATAPAASDRFGFAIFR